MISCSADYCELRYPILLFLLKSFRSIKMSTSAPRPRKGRSMLRFILSSCRRVWGPLRYEILIKFISFCAPFFFSSKRLNEDYSCCSCCVAATFGDVWASISLQQQLPTILPSKVRKKKNARTMRHMPVLNDELHYVTRLAYTTLQNIRFSCMICLINIPELMKSDIYTIYVYGVNQEYKLSMLLCVRWSHLFFIHQGSRAQSWPALCSCTSSSCLSCILRCFQVFLMHQLAQLHALLQNTATEFS